MEVRPIDANALIEKLEGINPVDYGAMSSYETHCGARDALSDAVRYVNDAPEISLNTLRNEIYQDAVAHGLWDYPQYCRTKCKMLDYVRAACVERIREELTEAMEAVSNPDEFAKELTDAAITIFSTFGHLGIDADKVFRDVMEANKGRAWKHGKA